MIYNDQKMSFNIDSSLDLAMQEESKENGLLNEKNKRKSI